MTKSTKKVIRFAGAIVAYLIGSGFASGQEVMQFFTCYGPVWGTVGALLTAGLMVCIAALVATDARKLKLKDANAIFRYYCGNVLGRFFEWLMPVFLLGIYVIMLSGASSLLNEYYGLPQWAGRTLMLLLSLGTVLLGLEKLTDIIGRIGPVIIFMALLVSVGCLVQNPQGIAQAAATYQTYDMAKATPFWWLSGINYATFCSFTLMPFLAGIGGMFDSDAECKRGGALGSVAFSLTALMVSLGISAYLPMLHDKAVPAVYMADKLVSGFGIVYSLVMLAGIYTTATPMLWAVANKLEHEDKSRKFKVIALVLAAVSYVGGRLPFAQLINIIYPYMGYFGMVVCAAVLFKHLVAKHGANTGADGKKQ